MALFKPEITLDAIGQFSAMQKEATIIAGGVPVSLHYAEGRFSAGSTGNGVPDLFLFLSRMIIKKRFKRRKKAEA